MLQPIAGTFLQTIPLTELTNWSVRYLLDTKLAYNGKYPLVPIGDFLVKNRTVVDIQDGVEYTRVTVSANNRGVSKRDTEKGENIGTKRQFLVSSGQFIVSKIDARNGAFGLVPDELEGAIVTNDFPLFDVDKSRILVQFLVLITTTTEFVKFAQSCSSGTTNRQRIDMDMFLLQKIPLPSLAEQNRIVNAYNEKIREAERLEKEAKELEEGIGDYINQTLGLPPIGLRDTKLGLQFIQFSLIERWDVLTGDLTIAKGLSQGTYPLRKIGEVYSFPKRSWNKRKWKSETFQYVELGNLDVTEGIRFATETKTQKAPSRATQVIKEGDLIIGTTRPYLKRFALVPDRYDGNIASSGFSVLEPADDYDLIYLKEFLCSSYGIEQIKNRQTGASYPAITNDNLKDIQVPQPPISVQTEIGTEVLTKRSLALRLRQEANDHSFGALEDFEQEIFG